MATELSGRRDVVRERPVGGRTWDETKPSLASTEFYVMLAAAAGTFVAGESNSSWDARWVWQVIAAIAIGYMVSRGLAKSGSPDRRRVDD